VESAPPSEVRICTENHQLSLSRLAGLDHAITRGIRQATDIVENQYVRHSDLIKRYRGSARHLHIEGKVGRCRKRSLQMETLLGSALIENQNIELFATLDREQKLIVLRKRVLGNDANLALRKPKRQIESAE